MFYAFRVCLTSYSTSSNHSDTNTHKLNKQRQSQWWCSQPRNKMQKLLEKFIDSLVFVCRPCCRIPSEIAILHLAKCPNEIIISQTIAAAFFFINSTVPWNISRRKLLYSISFYTYSVIIINPLIDHFSFENAFKMSDIIHLQWIVFFSQLNQCLEIN